MKIKVCFFIVLCGFMMACNTAEKRKAQNAFLIEIKGKNSVWYQDLMDVNSTPQLAAVPITNSLIPPIANAKKKNNQDYKFLIRGTDETDYVAFMEVVDALKANDQHKYDLLKTEETVDEALSKKDDGKMDLNMPRGYKQAADSIENSDTKLTLVLLNDKSIYGYMGNDMKNGKQYDYKNVRDAVLSEYNKYKDEFAVVIKSMPKATPQNAIDILDQMEIIRVKRYAMVDITEKEKEFLKELSYEHSKN